MQSIYPKYMTFYIALFSCLYNSSNLTFKKASQTQKHNPVCNKGTSGWNVLVYLQASLRWAALIRVQPGGREQACGGKQSMFSPQGCLTAINSCQVLTLILTKGLYSTPG